MQQGQHKKWLRRMATETARERLRRARQTVKDARASRRHARGRAEDACKAARVELATWRVAERKRVQAEIARLRAELAEGIATRRERVARCCGPDKAAARAEGDLLVAGARTALAELLEGRRLEKVWKGKGKAPSSAARHEQRGESDHDVEVNLTADQRIVWEKVKTKIKAGPRRSRTEAFLEWMHDHSADVARILEADADRAVREAVKHEAEQRKALEDMPKASEKRLRDYLAAGLEAIGVAGVPLVSPAAALTNVAIKHASARPPRPLSEQTAADPPIDNPRDLAAAAALRDAQDRHTRERSYPGVNPLLTDSDVRRAVFHGWLDNWGPDSRGFDQRERDDALDEYRAAFEAGRRAREKHDAPPFKPGPSHSLDTSAAPPAPPGRINIGAPYAFRLPLDHVGVGDLVTTQRGLQGPEGGISSGFPLIVTAIHGQNLSLEDDKGRPFAARPDWLTITNPNLSEFAEHPAKRRTPSSGTSRVEIGRSWAYDPATDAALDRVAVGELVVASRSLSGPDWSVSAGTPLRVTRIVDHGNADNPRGHVDLEDDQGHTFERIDTHWLTLPSGDSPSFRPLRSQLRGADAARAAEKAAGLQPYSIRDDLPAFAERVKQAAYYDPRVERFHDDRAYIASVYDWAAPKNMSAAKFKAELIEAQRAGLVRLTRADLVSAMPAELVERSEVSHPLGATFHFIALDAETAPPRKEAPAPKPAAPRKPRSLTAIRSRDRALGVRLTEKQLTNLRALREGGSKLGVNAFGQQWGKLAQAGYIDAANLHDVQITSKALELLDALDAKAGRDPTPF